MISESLLNNYGCWLYVLIIMDINYKLNLYANLFFPKVNYFSHDIFLKTFSYCSGHIWLES